MGGFALALGGFGQAAGQYGQQMREILEQRRSLLGQMWAKQAAEESDPDARSALLQHATDALSGKPMGGIIQDFSKTVQKRQKDNQALQNGVGTLAQSAGQQQQTPPPPPPGATPPGQVAGSGGNALPNVAQPATSPAANPANGGRIEVPPPVAGAPAQPRVSNADLPNLQQPDLIGPDGTNISSYLQGVFSGAIPAPSGGVQQTAGVAPASDSTLSAAAQNYASRTQLPGEEVTPQQLQSMQDFSGPNGSVLKRDQNTGIIYDPGTHRAIGHDLMSRPGDAGNQLVQKFTPQATPPLPASAAALPSPSVAAGTPGVPTTLPVPVTAAPLTPLIKDPQDIMNKYMGDRRWAAPANRPLMQQAMNDELAHNEALRQQADLVENRIRLMNDPRIAELPAKLKAQGYSEYVIPSIIGSLIGAPVPMMPGIGSALYTPERLTNLKAGDIRKQYPGTFDAALAGVADNAPVTLDVNKITREPMDVHVGTESNRYFVDANGNPVGVGARSGAPTGAPLSNLYTPGEVAPVQTGVDATGHPVFESRRDLIGPAPVAGAGVNPSFIPSKSVSEQPGAPPITTTRTKGGGMPVVVPPAINGGGIPPPVGGTVSRPASGAPKSVEFNDPLAKANYENYIAGKGPAPTGRQMQGVQLYASSHGLPMPDVLSAGAQKSISILDPVVTQIDDLTKRLNEVKGKNLIPSYMKYQLGFSTPYDDIFTGTAFERLRSGSAALQGIGSRSFPVFNEGMKHTPTFDRLHGLDPDSTKLMLDKLSEAKKIILEERAAAVADQKKSGVVPPITGAQGGSLMPPPTPQYSPDNPFAPK